MRAKECADFVSSCQEVKFMCFRGLKCVRFAKNGADLFVLTEYFVIFAEILFNKEYML